MRTFLRSSLVPGDMVGFSDITRVQRKGENKESNNDLKWWLSTFCHGLGSSRLDSAANAVTEQVTSFAEICWKIKGVLHPTMNNEAIVSLSSSL